MDERNPEDEAYRNRLAAQLFKLNNELIEGGFDLEGSGYLDRWHALHKLKQEYKRVTGIYPCLPPYRNTKFIEPGG